MCSQRKSLRRASSRERAGLEAQHAQRARGLRAMAAGALGELDTALSEEARARARNLNVTTTVKNNPECGALLCTYAYPVRLYHTRRITRKTRIR